MLELCKYVNDFSTSIDGLCPSTEHISLPLVSFWLLFHRAPCLFVLDIGHLLLVPLEWLFFLQALTGQLTTCKKTNVKYTVKETIRALRLNLNLQNRATHKTESTSCGNVGAAAPTCIALYGASAAYPFRPSPTTNLILPVSKREVLSLRTFSWDHWISSSMWSMPTTLPVSPTFNIW